MNRANETIRKHAKEKSVFLWEIADFLGVSEPTFMRKMRHELPEKDKTAITNAITHISENKTEKE